MQRNKSLASMARGQITPMYLFPDRLNILQAKSNFVHIHLIISEVTCGFPLIFL